ncbi:hypothetical protein Bca4012_083952 [Brassica carinata]
MSKDEQCFSSWGLVQILENKMKEKRIVKSLQQNQNNDSQRVRAEAVTAFVKTFVTENDVLVQTQEGGSLMKNFQTDINGSD